MTNTTVKKLFIAAIIFFLIALGIGWYFFFYKTGTKNPATGTAGGFPLNNQPVVVGPRTNTTSATGGMNVGPTQIGVLTELFSDPIAGSTMIGPADNDFVRLTERATGHVDDVSLTNTSNRYQLSNTTIPQIYESVWANTGSTTIFRYLDDKGTTIISYSGNFITSPPSIYATSTQPQAGLQGSFLPDAIESMAISPSAKQLFYMTESSTGGVGSIANIDGSKVATLFSSPVSEWNVQWPSDSIITLTTKPSSGQAGFMYDLSTKGVLIPILKNINGLITLTDPTGTHIAYSDDSLQLYVYDVKTGNTLVTPLRTFADKCVWSKGTEEVLYCAVPQSIPQNAYPDAWYQGLVSFSDTVYLFDINTGLTTKVISSSPNVSIDAENLSLSPDEDYLTFMNKNDLSLWGVRLYSSVITPSSVITNTTVPTNTTKSTSTKK